MRKIKATDRGQGFSNVFFSLNHLDFIIAVALTAPEFKCCCASQTLIFVVFPSRDICVFLTSCHAPARDRLEQDVKKLKADLQASRQVEQDLRSQIGSLGSAERSIRTELGQLRQENELLQNK